MSKAADVEEGGAETQNTFPYYISGKKKCLLKPHETCQNVSTQVSPGKPHPGHLEGSTEWKKVLEETETRHQIRPPEIVFETSKNGTYLLSAEGRNYAGVFVNLTATSWPVCGEGSRQHAQTSLRADVGLGV